MTTSENLTEMPIQYDDVAGKLAAELWNERSKYGLVWSEEAEGSVNVNPFTDPPSFFQSLGMDFSMETWSINISPDGISYLPYGHDARSYVLEVVENKNKYFALCICNNIIQEYFSSAFIIYPDKFMQKFREFLEDNHERWHVDYGQVINSIATFFAMPEFLQARGVFIKDRLLGSKFSATADPKAVGEMCASARVKSGLSKVAVAAAAGMQEKSIRSLEKGEHSPTLKTLQKYADSVGFDVRIELVPKD